MSGKSHATLEDEALDQLRQEPWFEIGRLTAPAFADRRAWLYRRVETLEFIGARSVRRRVSVDFEIPEGLPCLGERGAPGARLVPLSVFRKWPPLMDFDLSGPEGHPTSLYVRDTNKSLDFGLLSATIEAAVTSAGLPAIADELWRELAVLVHSDQPDQQGLAMVVGELADRLRPGDGQKRGDSVEEKVAIAIDLAGQLGGSSILWVPITGKRGTDMIVKFSYLDEFQPPSAWWKRVLIACSWRERTINLLLPHAGRSARYHLDMEVPGDGLELMSLQCIGYPSVFEALSQPATPILSEDATPPAPPEPRSPHGESTIVERRGHVYLAYDPHRSHRIVAEARIAAARGGFVQSCLVAAFAIACMMSITFANLSATEGGALDPAIVLLAAVPVVLGYLLVRPNSHAIERGHIIGVRTLMLLSGAVPILGALALVLAPEHLTEPIWAGLVITSWYFVAALGASWIFAAPRTEETRQHRWLRIVPMSGILGGLSVLAGTILACQPYSHIPSEGLRFYLRHSRGLVLAGSLLVALGLAALYTLIGGIWRTAGIRKSGNERAWRFGWTLVVGSGILFIWSTILVLTLESWQALRLTKGVHLYHHSLKAFMLVLDTIENAALIPMLVFIGASSIYLLLAPVRVGSHAVRREPEVEVWLVFAGTLIGVPLVMLRGVAILWPSDGHRPAQIAWVGFAVWLLAVGSALRYRFARLGPLPRLERR